MFYIPLEHTRLILHSLAFFRLKNARHFCYYFACFVLLSNVNITFAVSISEHIFDSLTTTFHNSTSMLKNYYVLKLIGNPVLLNTLVISDCTCSLILIIIISTLLHVTLYGSNY